jgi:hypothetical protein
MVVERGHGGKLGLATEQVVDEVVANRLGVHPQFFFEGVGQPGTGCESELGHVVFLSADAARKAFVRRFRGGPYQKPSGSSMPGARRAAACSLTRVFALGSAGFTWPFETGRIHSVDGRAPPAHALKVESHVS